MAHLMCNEEKAFCGREITNFIPADEYGDWDPEDHQDVVCRSCLEWHRALKPKHPDQSQAIPTNPT